MASKNAFSKLPPEVRRELLRHVKPSPTAQKQSAAANAAAAADSSTTSPSSSSLSSPSSSRYYWLAGCTMFVGGAASMPYLATQWIGNLSTKDTNLNAAGVRRGAFQNSGSKDAGPDRNWDWKNGQYVYPKGFAEHLKNNSDPNETDLGPSLEALAKQSGDDDEARK